MEYELFTKRCLADILHKNKVILFSTHNQKSVKTLKLEVNINMNGTQLELVPEYK